MPDLPPNTLIHFPVKLRAASYTGEQRTKPRASGRGTCPTAVTFTDDFEAPRRGATHHAIDIFGAFGLEIFATTAGVVPPTWRVMTGGRMQERPGVGMNDGDGGNYVMILDPNGYYHYYAHLERSPVVSINQSVRAGQLLGYLGDTGWARTSCQHLHYQVSQRTARFVYFNPYQELRRLAAAHSATATGRSLTMAR